MFSPRPKNGMFHEPCHRRAGRRKIDPIRSVAGVAKIKTDLRLILWMQQVAPKLADSVVRLGIESDQVDVTADLKIDEQLLCEALATLHRHRSDPDQWMDREDFEAELNRADAAGELPS